MASGTVKWFDEKKGYGFIVADEGGSDVYVHYTHIEMEGFKTLAKGQPVEFELIQEAGRAKAIHVKPVSKE